PPITAQSMDRLQKMVMVAAEQALRDSGHIGLRLTPELTARVGMILGYSGVQLENDYRMSVRIAWSLLQKSLEDELRKGHFSNELREKIMTHLEDKMIGSFPAMNEDTL